MKHRRRTCLTYLMLAIVAAISSACSPVLERGGRQITAEAVRHVLAPSGTLRVAINFGNPILASHDAATGSIRGVSVDLAKELGLRLGVPVELVQYDSAGRVFEGAKSDAWDIGFLAIDAARATSIDFTSAYVVIEGSYLVPSNSDITRNEQVDQNGVRVVVGSGSAYDLFLSRELKRASLVRVATSPEVSRLMIAQNMEVAAGVRQQLESDAKGMPDVRLLDGHFMVINQAMATPKGRDAIGLRFLNQFVQELKSSGFVASALARHGIAGAAVSPI